MANQVFVNLLVKRIKSALDHIEMRQSDYDQMMKLLTSDKSFRKQLDDNDFKLTESFNMPKKIELPREEVKKIYIE